MSLAPGARLGAYEIVSFIAAGGMGEVYKAVDTRLDRVVALKIVLTEFDERFDREARAIATLNHPHICTLHDVGSNYLVMEYVDGTALRGPLPIAQALKYAAEIADALDAAHKQHIVHRDHEGRRQAARLRAREECHVSAVAAGDDGGDGGSAIDRARHDPRHCVVHVARAVAGPRCRRTL